MTLALVVAVALQGPPAVSQPYKLAVLEPAALYLAVSGMDLATTWAAEANGRTMKPLFPEHNGWTFVTEGNPRLQNGRLAKKAVLTVAFVLGDLGVQRLTVKRRRQRHAVWAYRLSVVALHVRPIIVNMRNASR